MKKTLLIVGGLVVIVLLGIAFKGGVSKLGGVNAVNNYDTTSSGFTHATSSVVITAGRIFATINRISYITNQSASVVTCSLDAANTTAASSTIVSGRGVTISASTTVAFGECRGGATVCYPHKGAVNCLATVTSTINTSVQ